MMQSRWLKRRKTLCSKKTVKLEYGILEIAIFQYFATVPLYPKEYVCNQWRSLTVVNDLVNLSRHENFDGMLHQYFLSSEFDCASPNSFWKPCDQHIGDIEFLKLVVERITPAKH